MTCERVDDKTYWTKRQRFVADHLARGFTQRATKVLMDRDLGGNYPISTVVQSLKIRLKVKLWTEIGPAWRALKGEEYADVVGGVHPEIRSDQPGDQSGDRAAGVSADAENVGVDRSMLP